MSINVCALGAIENRLQLTRFLSIAVLCFSEINSGLWTTQNRYKCPRNKGFMARHIVAHTSGLSISLSFSFALVSKRSRSWTTPRIALRTPSSCIPSYGKHKRKHNVKLTLLPYVWLWKLEIRPRIWMATLTAEWKDKNTLMRRACLYSDETVITSIPS